MVSNPYNDKTSFVSHNSSQRSASSDGSHLLKLPSSQARSLGEEERGNNSSLSIVNIAVMSSTHARAKLGSSLNTSEGNQTKRAKANAVDPRGDDLMTVVDQGALSIEPVSESKKPRKVES